MIDYIVYGEFDINLGNVVHTEYPVKTGINESTLASYLIPEGAHNFDTDSFSFIANRKVNSEEGILNSIRSLVEKMNVNKIKYLSLKDVPGYNVYNNKVIKLKEIYNFNSFSMVWDLVKLTDKDPSTLNLCMKISEDEKQKFFNFVIYNSKNNEVFFKIPIHQDIQFKKLNSHFASIYTLNSQAIGFNFDKEEELNDLEKILEHESDLNGQMKSEELSATYNHDINLNTESEIYFMCCLETKLDKSVKRGAIMKSVAIGTTKLINLNVFKGLLRFMLDEMFRISAANPKPEEKTLQIKKVFEQAFKGFNNIPSKYFFMNSYVRGIKSYLSADEHIYADEKVKFLEIDINKYKIKIDLAQLDSEEKLIPSSLKTICTLFKENTMMIYDAVLSDKKILFVGDSTTKVEKLGSLVFACVSLVCTPCMGMIKRINPYKSLYDIDDILKESNVIYAVTNPIFKMKQNYWDLMCEVDSGKVTMSESYKKQFQLINRESDQFFIKELLYKINNEFISNYEVCKYFRIYTNHILNITGEQYFSDEIDLMNEINKQWQRKLKVQNSSIWKLEKEMMKIKETVNIAGRTLKLIYNHIDNIYKRKLIDKEELIMIFSDIDKFLVNEYFINMFIYILTNYTVDYQIFFNALLSKHSELEVVLQSIVKKLKEHIYGSQLIRRLNFMYQLRINSIEVNNLKEIDV